MTTHIRPHSEGVFGERLIEAGLTWWLVRHSWEVTDLCICPLLHHLTLSITSIIYIRTAPSLYLHLPTSTSLSTSSVSGLSPLPFNLSSFSVLYPYLARASTPPTHNSVYFIQVAFPVTISFRRMETISCLISFSFLRGQTREEGMWCLL